jgi:fermentation-respiration switch protein FrsA (DUF1100 family)
MAEMRRMVFALLRIAVAVVVVAVTLLVVFQGKLVWVPSGAPEVTPSLLKIPYRDVTLTTRDGVALHAWLLPAEEPRGLLVFCHGNGGSIGDRIDDGAELRRLGLTTLLFDYRGYGGNGGALSEEGTYLDAEAAYDFLAALPAEGGAAPAKPLPILAFGESLGGAIAIELARRRPLTGLVTESTFTSIADMGAELYPFLPVRWLLRIRYASVDKVADVKCPWLMLHSRADDIVPYAHGERLLAAATAATQAAGRSPPRFAELRGGHNEGGFLVSPDGKAALASFLDSVLR